MPLPAILGLVGAGLSVLPKLTDAWGSVAALFGKKVPGTVEEAGKLAGEIAEGIGSGKVPIEKQIELRAIFYQHEEKIEELRLREKQMDLEDLQHQREQFVKLWTADTTSTNKYVAETRPRILRDLWVFIKWYMFLSVVAVFGLAYCNVPADVTTVTVGYIKWGAVTLIGVFTAAFLGYTTARSIDKRNPQVKDETGAAGMVLRAALGKTL